MYAFLWISAARAADPTAEMLAACKSGVAADTLEKLADVLFVAGPVSGPDATSLATGGCPAEVVARALRASVAARPDALGGVVIGSVAAFDEWGRLTDGHPYRMTEVAGQRGALIATPCGDTAHRLSFQVTYSNDPRLQHESVAPTPTPTEAGRATFEQLGESLVGSGWELVNTSRKDDRSVEGRLYYQADRQRLLQVSCEQDPRTAGVTCTVILVAEADTPCTAGL
ncbi:MAG: hypothetical protein ABMA64_17415 [Myxococcota bacterium]